MAQRLLAGSSARRVRHVLVVVLCALGVGVTATAAEALSRAPASSGARVAALVKAHPACNAFINPGDVTTVTGIQSALEGKPETAAAWDGGGQWFDWGTPINSHWLPGSLCQFIATNSASNAAAPWDGEYDSTGYVGVAWGASAAYWRGLKAYLKRTASAHLGAYASAPYTSLNADEFVNAVNLSANGYGPYSAYPTFPTTLYFVTRWTPHHNLIQVALTGVSLGKTESVIQGVLKRHPTL